MLLAPYRNLSAKWVHRPPAAGAYRGTCFKELCPNGGRLTQEATPKPSPGAACSPTWRTSWSRAPAVCRKKRQPCSAIYAPEGSPRGQPEDLSS